MRILPVLLLVAMTGTASAASTNILYMNSTRGSGTGALGSFRSVIADALDDYDGGTTFDVTFIQTHVAGNLASQLNGNAVGHFDQIWFDTTILNTNLLNAADMTALNAWAANDQPEFILDSSYFYRNKLSPSLSTTAHNMTVNEALALRDQGGGILIGTDHYQFTATANAVLNNFGFDALFTGSYYTTSNGSFVGDLLLNPLPIGTDFFTGHLQGLSTSNVPIGTHVLNANGGNRTIEIYENLFSNSPGHVSHIGASFDTGDTISPIDDPAPPIPEPGTASLLGLGLAAAFLHRRRRRAR